MVVLMHGGRSRSAYYYRARARGEGTLKRLLLGDLLVDGGLLVLSVLGDEVGDVGLSLLELHLVHALAGVPVKVRLDAVQLRELVEDEGEEELHGRAVAHESTARVVAGVGDVAHGRLDVVGDPLTARTG